VYAIGGGATAVVNHIPLAQPFSQAGPLVVNSPALLSQLINSGVRFSTGFTTAFLPNLQTTIAKGAMLAQAPAQTQAALNAVVATFVAYPLSYTSPIVRPRSPRRATIVRRFLRSRGAVSSWRVAGHRASSLAKDNVT